MDTHRKAAQIQVARRRRLCQRGRCKREAWEIMKSWFVIYILHRRLVTSLSVTIKEEHGLDGYRSNHIIQETRDALVDLEACPSLVTVPLTRSLPCPSRWV